MYSKHTLSTQVASWPVAIEKQLVATVVFIDLLIEAIASFGNLA